MIIKMKKFAQTGFPGVIGIDLSEDDFLKVSDEGEITVSYIGAAHVQFANKNLNPYNCCSIDVVQCILQDYLEGQVLEDKKFLQKKGKKRMELLLNAKIIGLSYFFRKCGFHDFGFVAREYFQRLAISNVQGLLDVSRASLVENEPKEVLDGIDMFLTVINERYRMHFVLAE